MLKHASTLKDSCNRFVAEPAELDTDRFKIIGWQVLTALANIHERFEAATLDLQGHALPGGHDVLSEVVSCLDCLQQHRVTEEKEFRQNQSYRAVNSIVVTMPNNGVEELEKYTKKLQNIPVYSAAVSLDPGCNL
jgi:hypothetical protein